MIHIQITPASGVPSYRQIMDQINYYIASGTLREGDGLPSIRELASRLTLNPSTIVKAYGELAHGGAIELRQGKGAFVARGGKKLTRKEMKRALRGQARRLAVEAKQLAVSRELLLEVLQEELDRLEGE